MGSRQPDEGEIDIDADFRTSGRHAETESFGYEVESLDSIEGVDAVPRIDLDHRAKASSASRSASSADHFDPVDLDREFERAKAARAARLKGSVSGEFAVEPVDEAVIRAEEERGRNIVEQAESALDVDRIYDELEKTGNFEAALEGMKLRFSLRTLFAAVATVGLVIGIAQWGLLDEFSFASFVVAAVIGLAGAHAFLNIGERRRIRAILRKREFELRKARIEAGYLDPNEEIPERPEEPVHGVIGPIELLRSEPPVTVAELVMGGLLAGVASVLVLYAESLTQASAGVGATIITGFAVQVADLEIPRFLLIAWWLAMLGFACVLIAAIVMLPFGGLLGGS